MPDELELIVESDSREFVPIKITIIRELRKGRFVMGYPDFNALDSDVRRGADWAQFVDLYGGWHYDRISKMGVTDPTNPDPDTQHGVLLVPEDFARAAVEAFPDRVEYLDEDEFDDFFNNRAHFDAPEELVNEKRVNEIRAKYGLHSGRLAPLPTMDASDAAAIDPSQPHVGIVANPNKTAARMKQAKGITIKSLK